MDRYFIADLTDGVQIIYKKNAPFYINADPGPTGVPLRSDNCDAGTGDGCYPHNLKILFYYTPAGWARASYYYGGDQISYALTCLTQMHEVFSNCGNLPDFDINSVFAGWLPYNITEEVLD